MSKKDEALKLALEALEYAIANVYDTKSNAYKKCYPAITALREALAEQPAQQGCMRCNTPKKCALYGCSPLTWPSEKPAPVAKPHEQEPVAWMEMVVANLVREGVNKHKARELAQHFYTSPPTLSLAQRTWVGLTDEDLAGCDEPEYKAARYWETTLKEKNT